MDDADSEFDGLWIDYFMSHYPLPAYSWREDAIHRMQGWLPVASILDDGNYAGVYQALICATCGTVTPHRVLGLDLR